MESLAIGLDFGTESVRAVAVGVTTASVVAEVAYAYRHGVLDDVFPPTGERLPPHSALQDPRDHEDALTRALSALALELDPARVVGIGVAFTACTPLPLDGRGRPLCESPQFAQQPHAFAKLWKHHGAEAEARELTAVARARGEAFLAPVSGRLSSEWLHPKALEIFRRAPEVFLHAAAFVEGGDFVVELLTGQRTRNACAAGYKGLYDPILGFPSRAYLEAVAPGFSRMMDALPGPVLAPGTKVGGLCESLAHRCGLPVGIPVAAATIDAHAGVLGMGVAREGILAVLLGTSACHLALHRQRLDVRGVAGVVADGILPGFYGYESGQAAYGDLLGWFVRDVLQREGDAGFAALSRSAAALVPGESGLLALDWINGCRTPLMDARLSGVLLGWTLATRPHHIYRALLESAAFGTRVILDRHQEAGLRIDRLAVGGGLVKDRFLLQVLADVAEVPVEVAGASQAGAGGAAILGALAASRVRDPDSIAACVAAMTPPAQCVLTPDPARAPALRRLFQLYSRCADHFGRDATSVMYDLESLRSSALAEKGFPHDSGL